MRSIVDRPGRPHGNSTHTGRLHPRRLDRESGWIIVPVLNPASTRVASVEVGGYTACIELPLPTARLRLRETPPRVPMFPCACLEPVLANRSVF